MRGLELRHLRLVTSIAEHGTMTRAAGALGLTQSALSQQLLDLEARLGSALFLRTGRQMILTQTGRDFARRSQEILALAADFEAWTQRSAGGETRTLQISTDQIFSFRWLPGVLARFRRAHPQIEIRIRRHADLFAEIVAGKLDLAITFPRKSPRREIEIVPLFDDEMVAILPPGHALAVKRALRVQDLEGQDLLYHMELRDSALHRRFLQPLGIRPATVTVVDQPDAILELVKSGFGMSLLPRRSVQPEAARGEIVVRRLRSERREARLQWAAAVRRRGRQPVVDELLDLIRHLPAR